MKQAEPKTTPHGPVKQNVKKYKDRLCNLLVELGKAYCSRSCGTITRQPVLFWGWGYFSTFRDFSTLCPTQVETYCI